MAIPDTLQGDRSTFRQGFQEASDRTGLMTDPGALGMVVEHGEDREVLAQP
ncbi:MAG: hypothetical protein M1389_12385 [Chloroflexi bacterium]|nr:hypothetical protein [Chloroflexota bacterium]